jgi:2-polyprenyl-3-methyl-5-hydroxy-6-metoxy-1,4-benzoquinol methylase
MVNGLVGVIKMGESSHFETNELSRYRANWETNARIDSKWSVLSLPGKLGAKWNDTPFYETGRSEVDHLMTYMEQNGIWSARENARCLDFGCGVGRLTEALAVHFHEVVGVDISSTMLDEARSHLTQSKLKNVQYRLMSSGDLTPLGLFDFIYSNITLQHLNNQLQCMYLQQFSRILRTGGLAVFQLPSQKPIFSGMRLRTLRGLLPVVIKLVRQRKWPWQIRMEMNILSEPAVERTAGTFHLTLLKKAYIDWEAFYSRHVFRMVEDPPSRRTYPTSPMYFFLKG